MWRAALAAVLLLYLAAPAEAQERCTEGKNVAADTHARVYTVKSRWYACDRASARPIRLAGVRKGALARVKYPYAAVTTGDGRLRLFHVRDRSKAAMRVPGRVTDLVLTYDGVATVIAGGQVLRMNAKGEVVKLDEGAVTPGSLAASGSGVYLYWIKDGAVKSATFAEPPDRELQARRAPHCGRSKAKGYVADAGGWLVWQSSEDEFVGCLNGRTKGPRFLGSDDFYGATIASPFVALVLLGLSPYGSGSNEVVVYDLRSTDESDYTSYNAHSWVSQLQVTNRGIAYILEAGAVNIDGQVIGLPELFRLDARGRVTEVDAGAIAGGSLTLTPDTRRLYWTKDGVARTR